MAAHQLCVWLGCLSADLMKSPCFVLHDAFCVQPQGDYLLELWALGRLALYVALGAEGLTIPMKRLTTLMRRYDHLVAVMSDTPYGFVTASTGQDVLAAW